MYVKEKAQNIALKIIMLGTEYFVDKCVTPGKIYYGSKTI